MIASSICRYHHLLTFLSLFYNDNKMLLLATISNNNTFYTYCIYRLQFAFSTRDRQNESPIDSNERREVSLIAACRLLAPFSSVQCIWTTTEINSPKHYPRCVDVRYFSRTCVESLSRFRSILCRLCSISRLYFAIANIRKFYNTPFVSISCICVLPLLPFFYLHFHHESRRNAG